MKITYEEVIDTMNYEIEHYQSIEEFGKDVFPYDEEFIEEDFIEEDFQEKLDNGFIQEITLGTYNGATDTFTPMQLNKHNIYKALVQYLHESDYADVQYMFEDEWGKEIDQEIPDVELVYELLVFFDVFVIKDRVFLYRD